MEKIFEKIGIIYNQDILRELLKASCILSKKEESNVREVPSLQESPEWNSDHRKEIQACLNFRIFHGSMNLQTSSDPILPAFPYDQDVYRQLYISLFPPATDFSFHLHPTSAEPSFPHAK